MRRPPHYLVLHESGPCVSCVQSLRSGYAARADRVSRCRPPERRGWARPRGGNRSAPGDRNPLARSSRRSQRGRRARCSPVGHRRGDCRAPPANRRLRRGSPARGRDGAACCDFPRRSRRIVRIAVTPRNHHQIFLDNRVKLARLVYVSNRVICSWASGEPSRPTPGWPRSHRCNPTAPSADAVLRLSAPALPDWGKSYIGASGRKDDWPEQWTVSGLESLYDLRERSEHEN